MQGKVQLLKTPRRPYHHGNLREELLLAAERRLVVDGIQDISLRELSRELGVSHTSPRRHFANKQALLDALALRGFERFDALLAVASKPSRADFKFRLSKLAHVYVGFAVKHQALLNLMLDAKLRPEAPDELIEVSNRAFGRAHTIFEQGQADGEVIPSDSRRLSIFVFSTILGLAAICRNGKFRGTPIDRMVEEIIELMLLGMRPRI